MMDQIAHEKEVAKKLRKTAWWQRKVGVGVCFYCRCPLAPRDATMDHMIPLSRGGKSTKGNLVPACKDCNSKKKYMTPLEWALYADSSSRALEGDANQVGVELGESLE